MMKAKLLITVAELTEAAFAETVRRKGFEVYEVRLNLEPKPYAVWVGEGVKARMAYITDTPHVEVHTIDGAMFCADLPRGAKGRMRLLLENVLEEENGPNNSNNI